MYLTRLELDTRKRATMKALFSPNMFHGAIEAAFPGERERKLWRIDKLGQHTYLLMLSEQQPQLAHMVQQFGVSDILWPWDIKNYDTLLDQLETQTRWQFRLVANPTKSSRSEMGSRGRVYAHVTPYYQKKWLLEQSKKKGFAIREDDIVVTESRWLKFYKGSSRKNPVSLLSVTYEGYLTVTDKALFRSTLINGLGRGKAYGLGMLTVIRMRRNHE